MLKWIGQLMQGKNRSISESSDSSANRAVYIKNQANERWAQGDLAGAEAFYREAIAANPRLAEAHNNLGALLRQEGRLDEAERCLNAAISANGKLANAFYNLGLLHEQVGNLSAALVSFERTAELDPGFESAYIKAAEIHTCAKRFADAAQVLKTGVAALSGSFDLIMNLGQAYHAVGQLAKAEECCRKAISMQSDRPEPYVGIAAVLADAKQFQRASDCLKQALALKPDLPAAYFNLGVIARMQSEFDEARKYLQLAVANQPDYADAYNELGIVLLQCEQLNEARASFQKALDCKPDYPIASNNLGIVFRALGKLKEAQACFENAIALDTAYIDPYVNLANMCAAASFFREAAECFGKALELNPESANLHYGKGNALYSMGDMEQARTQYSEALALRPAFWEAKFALAVATLPAVFRIGDKPDEIREAFAQAVTELHSLPDRGTITGDVPLVVTQPFFLAYQEHDNRALLSRFGALLIRLMRNWLDLTGCEREPPAAAGMIRLGLISAHIRNQSVWTAIVKGWFQHLDKSAFELHVFHLSPRCDKETEWAIANSNSFRQCPDNLKTCAREIWAKNLDVLIYPEIGMDPPTVTLATLRLAPVQVAAWGHPETTGLSTVDYYLSAEDFEPVGAQNYYSERLVLLPHLGCCYQPLGTTDAAPDFAHLKIDASLPILLCPGVPQKYAPQHDNVWAEIARRLGKCQLVFFSLSDDIKAARLRERLIVTFESAGLKLESHAVFAPWLNRPTFFGLMKRSTLMLDTLGFSGFNTAIQAIECGLPLVTLEGHFMRGRLASGILRRMGIDELIAKDESTYIELVVRLVRDEAFNRRMRNRIEETRGVLFGDLAPIRAMEDFFRQVATRH